MTEDAAQLDKPARCYLSLVVPAYNESKRLAAMLKDAVKHLDERAEKKTGFTYEIIVVDDGSTDATGELVELMMKGGMDHLHLLKRPVNEGKGAAVVHVHHLP